MAKQAIQNVTIRVRIGDAEIEVTGPSDFVDKRVHEFVEQQKGRGPSVPQSTQTGLGAARPAAPSLKAESPAQFFKKASAKSDPERVLAAGYYLEKLSSMESFTTAEIVDTIRKAKIPRPTNPSDAVAKNIKKGMIMPAGSKEGKRAFTLTSDGEEAVNSALGA
jgi:hypothetical protein